MSVQSLADEPVRPIPETVTGSPASTIEIVPPSVRKRVPEILADPEYETHRLMFVVTPTIVRTAAGEIDINARACEKPGPDGTGDGPGIAENLAG